MISEERLKELAALRGDPVVTSLYLDVDGRRFPKLSDAEPRLSELFRSARRRAEARDEGATEAVERTLAQIQRRFRDGFDRSRIRGVVFFGTGDVFEVVELPVAVRNQVTVNQGPALQQLELLRETYEPLVVALVDRQRARIFRFELGELVEHSELLDDVPPRVDGTDEGGLVASHVQAHADEVARRHYRHAADAVRQVLDHRSAKHVVLGGPAEAVAELEDQLHPYVRDRVVARLSISAQASEADIRQAAVAAEEDIERREQEAVVARLKDAAHSDGRGVAGLDDTLQAAYERRIETLVVSSGYEEPGWRCGACEFLATVGSECRVCGAAMERVDDVITDAIDLTLTAGASVWVCENADLDVMGRVGALLRY